MEIYASKQIFDKKYIYIYTNAPMYIVRTIDKIGRYIIIDR